jgi:hypothetical protein
MGKAMNVLFENKLDTPEGIPVDCHTCPFSEPIESAMEKIHTVHCLLLGHSKVRTRCKMSNPSVYVNHKHPVCTLADWVKQAADEFELLENSRKDMQALEQRVIAFNSVR